MGRKSKKCALSEMSAAWISVSKNDLLSNLVLKTLIDSTSLLLSRHQIFQVDIIGYHDS